MIANDGVGFTPHLVKYGRRTCARGEVRADRARSRRTRLDVKPEHLAVIKHALVGVNKEGTSAAAFKDAQVHERPARPAPRRCTR